MKQDIPQTITLRKPKQDITGKLSRWKLYLL